MSAPRLQAREPLLGHTRRVSSVALTADGARVLSGSLDRELRLWDVGEGACARILVGETSDVNAVALSPDGQWALSGAKDKTLRLWELETGRCVATEATSGAALCLSLSADGRRAAVGTYDRKVLVWDVGPPA